MNGLPRRTSKRLAHVEAKPLVEVKTSSRAREDEAEVNTNQTKSGKTEVTTTSAEELESASVDLKEDEKSEKPPDNDSSLIDLFMDPCIEFAIKILTGAIPLEEASRIYEASPIKASSSSSVLPFGDIWMILVLNLRSRSSPVRLTWRMILTPILHSHYDVTPLPNDKLYKAKGNHFF